MFLSRLPPSLQLFFLLRLLFSFGPSSNIRDGKLTVQQQQEEATEEEEALPRARMLAGDNKDKKVELGSSARSLSRCAAAAAIANDAITNFARRSGERGKEERERDSGQPWWSVNESTNDD